MQVEPKTKGKRSYCQPGKRFTKKHWLKFSFSKEKQQQHLTLTQQELKWQTTRRWKEGAGILEAKMPLFVWACACTCARACVSASRVWRQTWGLFSCQCPAATPAGLCFTVTPKLTNTPEWPRTVCLCACVHTSAWRRLCMSRELNSFQNEPYPKWLMPAVPSSHHT